MAQDPYAVKYNEGKIDAIFADLNQSRLPGAVCAVAIDGKPVYRKGFGLASMDLPVVLSPSIRLRIQHYLEKRAEPHIG